MDKAEPPKHTTMVTKSSIKRKPLANLTNIVRNPNHTFQSKPVSSTASDSSIGSTQNHPIKPPTLTTDHLVGDENQTTQARTRSSQNTKSKTPAAVPFYQTSSLGRKTNVKEGSVSICSSTMNKIKDQGKINQSRLVKTINDGKKISAAPHNSSMEKNKDNRKSTDVSLSVHLMKNTNNSTDKDKDKGKDNRKSSGVPLSGQLIKNTNNSMVKDKGKENSNSGLMMSDSLMKRKDKGKAIAEPLDYPSRKKLKYDMMGFGGPLKGVVIKEREGTVTGSGSVNIGQKDKGKGVSTSISYYALEKKDQQSSCPPILRTTSKRSGVDETDDVLHSKLQTEPPPNKKKKRCSTKEIDEAYALPKEFVEQQRAYFKEIDDFELEVEEV
ncbi:hypothetical protein HanRHA438_Chr08g0346641 [Helianthus annuus]|uniref:Sororin C-terminal region domain-containing protein n=1 Tax=Helianthus annuus TaxID=4232 RepID=A0A251U5Q6_HELAN|nr:uncharacterized protein LOC110872742 [Helianthus annuus]KAF5795054.1 hypothetical protein HanXRQr2_Chr08g0335271 [Helianthus annuus]KAJ0897521.1 hypothetical protein HanRHA438_Chr08g0346641 [Helianthus annuus]